MPISELVHVARSTDDDGSCELALRLAEEWGYETVRFVRSSANHVFVCAAPGREQGILRFRIERSGSAEAAARIAETASRLAVAGLPVARALLTADGDLAARAEDGSRRYVGTMFSAVAGEQLDSAALTREQAHSWGAALARLHDEATRLAPGVPAWIDVVAAAGAALASPELRAAGARIVEQLRGLPVSDDLVGVGHGDPELDNVVWQPGGEPCFVDLDDASRSWFAADICFALRDFLTPEGQIGSQPELVTSFVDGYRDRRPLTEEELGRLPLFRRGHALVTLAGLERVLTEPVSGAWPPWARQLHARIDEAAVGLAEALTVGNPGSSKRCG